MVVENGVVVRFLKSYNCCIGLGDSDRSVVTSVFINSSQQNNSDR
jgi:hypothetical protein